VLLLDALHFTSLHFSSLLFTSLHFTSLSLSLSWCCCVHQALPAASAGASLEVLAGEWLSTTAPAPPPPPPPPPGPPSTCKVAAENANANLGCPAGQKITAVTFASFGNPTGSCATGFKLGSCNAGDSISMVISLCVGKNTCAVPATNTRFKGDPCNGTLKILAAQVKCGASASASAPALGLAASAAPWSVKTDVPVVVLATTTTTTPPPLPPRPDNGTFPAISGGEQQYENHVLRAGNGADLETVFSWHGFQYVRVAPNGTTGFKGALDSIVGLEIHTNMSATGMVQFGGDGTANSAQTRNADVLNGIYSMTLQSQRTNVAAYMPTDCPTREKHGW
jgi:hypothetical protein